MQNAKLPTFPAMWFRLLPYSCDSHMRLQLTRRWCEVMHIDRHDIQVAFHAICWRHFAQLAEYFSLLSFTYTLRKSPSLWALCRWQRRVAGDLVLGHANPLKLSLPIDKHCNKNGKGFHSCMVLFPYNESPSCEVPQRVVLHRQPGPEEVFVGVEFQKNDRNYIMHHHEELSWIVMNHCRISSHHHNHHTHHHKVNNGLCRYTPMM